MRHRYTVSRKSKVPFADRFFAKVQKTDGCWNWTGAKLPAGYGRFVGPDGQCYSHRYSYEMVRGRIPEGLTIDHLCRNPSCVNPAHMEAVTLTENIRRANHKWETCLKGHPLIDGNLCYEKQETIRRCLICRRASLKRFRDSVRAAAAATALMIIFCVPLLAQEHNHPPQDEALHLKFYSNWFMPDQPNKSCCNKADCYPTQARFHDGHWFAQRREDGMWMFVPDNKLERNRDNPDGRSHVCAPPPANFGFSPFTVFCFSLGGGI